jgi:hypothetical protein
MVLGEPQPRLLQPCAMRREPVERRQLAAERRERGGGGVPYRFRAGRAEPRTRHPQHVERVDAGRIIAWFTVLALFAPIAIGVGRLAANRAMRVAVPVGVAAAVVQVIGLARWPLLVPGYAASGNRDAFATAHRILGTLIGETLGYALTAAWTLLVLIALGRSFAGRWFPALGGAAAVLILAGVLSPLHVPGVDLANFVGYVLWSLWLVAFAVVLVRRPTVPASQLVAGGRV